MSEETPPAKKAARKTVRKKSATKRAPRKNTKSESDHSDEQLPLEASPDLSGPESSLNRETEEEVIPAKQQGREPRSGVRDARRETAGEPISGEVSEKLVPDDEGEKTPKEKPRQSSRKEQRENSDDSSQRDQGKQDQNERRGRGRGRGGRDRDRPEKREPKPRISVDAKDLAKKAWKIFESEVTEEGLALLDDNGLRDYARSSFNAARLFLEEKSRVVGREKSDKEDKKKQD